MYVLHKMWIFSEKTIAPFYTQVNLSKGCIVKIHCYIMPVALSLGLGALTKLLE